MKKDVIDNLECSIMWCGEPTFAECLASIKAQTYTPSHIEIIKDVSPLNVSINTRHNKLKKKYSVKVDADMILYPCCFEILYKKIMELGDSYWSVSVMLEDPFIGKMGGVHIQRSEYIKNVTVPNIIGCDRFLSDLMKKQGYKWLEIKQAYGEHKCDWSHETVFKRHMRMGQKHAYFKSYRHNDWIRSIGRKWLEGNPQAFTALAGYCHGLLTYASTEKDKHFGKFEYEKYETLMKEGIVPK